ncbi:efflux RND transporter periplasmic adaptor subunit [Sulfuriferula thiophila]|uniref:efflux RND transporter periplasmic adaptor subunit n=1 Tax=Sulfuriferula thiophila TaxID=1781211 RepID=UPI000F60BFED|nr:efflux RND transporter periplasmic adaptor subunit [Sulfuriferula thiophila]
MKKSYLWLMLIAAGVVGGGAYYQYKSHSAAPAEYKVKAKADTDILQYAPGAPQLTAIHSEVVQRVPVPLADPLNGKVTYNENLTARIAAPISGRVLSIKAELGDSVRAGQTLLLMDAPDLGNAIADTEKATADVRLKQLALNRAHTLYQGEAMARKDLEAAESDYAASNAEARRAALRLKNLMPNGMSNTNEGYALRSPIAGVVAQRQVNPGEEIRPDLADPLFTITNPDQVWVSVDLPENLIAKARIGRPVSIAVDAYPDKQFNGRIEKIAPALDPVTRRITVRCSVDNAEQLLKPEMYARVTLIADISRTAFRIPNTALVTDGLYSYVFIEHAPGVLQKRKVVLSAQDRDFSYTVDGLKANDRIVTAGALLLNSELGAAK